jgi:hypothetical protein
VRGIMKLRPILITAALLFVAFGLGVGVGLRLGRSPSSERGAEPASGPISKMVAREDPQAPEGPAASAGSSVVGSPSACVDFRNAPPLEGKSGCVAGKVLKVFSSRAGNTFLDFCEDYHDCPFTSVVFASDKSKFGDLESLQGRRVEIQGDVVAFRGHAEIIIHDPQQVRSSP